MFNAPRHATRFATLAVLALLGGTPVANADLLTFDVVLDGLSESPPNASPGTGIASITFDTVTHSLHLNMSFTGLIGTTTACHIHAATAAALTGTAGVATQTPTFSGFPLGVSSGAYDNTFDMSLATSYNPGFITLHTDVPTAEAFLVQAMLDSKSYLNIHSTAFPGGEIRGFLIPVPTPSGLAVLGMAGIAAGRRRRA